MAVLRVYCFGHLTALAAGLVLYRNAPEDSHLNVTASSFRTNGSLHTRGVASLTRNRTDNRSDAHQAPASPSFPAYVESVTTGRGIWKWNNALVAYERHFAKWKMQPVRIGEVGVWSGGSLLMWPATLGPLCRVFGMDISQDALAFQDAQTSITLLDQGNTEDWGRFFATVTPELEILVDDGGHTAPLMLTTTVSVWHHLTPGGVLAIEDIHGAHYLESFFKPVAQFYGGAAHADLASLHIYPFLLVAQKTGGSVAPLDPSTTPGAVIPATGRISTLQEVSGAMHAAPPGSIVLLENPAWGTFLGPYLIDQFFEFFNQLHTPQQMYDVPPGCALTNAAVCSSNVVNSLFQQQITGVHILPAKLVIEVAAAPPVIQAVRHGSEWVKYPTHS